MDYLQPGLREIGRRAARFFAQVRLTLTRRRKERALTELGLLAWQSADFDAETQRQVDEIQNVEREQSRRLNEAATTAAEIRELTSQRDLAQRAHADTRKQLEANLRKANETKALIERQIGEKRKVEPNFQKRMPELERELRETNKLYSELLVMDRQTPKMKQELIRLRERIVAIPNEKNDLRTSHLRAVTELRTLEETLARQTEATEAAQQRIHYSDTQWQAREAELAHALREKEKTRATAERSYATLETAKRNPYLRIGEVLFSSGIGPINQPEVLDAVRALELKIALLEGQITDSRAASGHEEPQALKISLVLWMAVAVLVLFVLIRVVV